MILTILLLASVTILMLVAVSYFTRGTPLRDARLIGAYDRMEAGDPLFRETVAVLTSTPISAGNRVEILQNGAVFQRLFEDLSAARRLITWHVFWFKPGRVTDRLAEILCARARAGVQVLFLYDYFGAKGTPGEYFERLRRAGVEVVAFRPPSWRTLYKFQQRMHMRTVVIDGRCAYTGGFGMADEWQGDGRSPGAWRDTSVRLEGRLVDQVQGSFIANWGEATGQLLVGDGVLPLRDGGAPGTTCAGIMYNAPSLGSTNAERFFMLTLHGARERLFITNAYFVPNRHFRQELIDASARGVDVRVLTPGPNTDRPSAFHAGRAGYERLLEGGVRIYHYRPTMVHAKTMVADGIWATIGTINFDNRSMVLNDELTVVVQDRECARALERQFLEDLELADEVDLQRVRARGAVDRLRERAFQLVSPLL